MTVNHLLVQDVKLGEPLAAFHNIPERGIGKLGIQVVLKYSCHIEINPND